MLLLNSSCYCADFHQASCPLDLTLQTEVLHLPFGKSQVSHTAMNSLCHKRVKTNQTASNSVFSNNSCECKWQLTNELSRETLAQQELFTLFHKGLSLQNISMIQNDLNVQVVILTAAKIDMR